MDRVIKTRLTNIGKIDFFNSVIEKLVFNETFTEKEATYALTCAMLFIKEYEKNPKNKSYIEFAYYIILKYSLISDNYKPLYDFSVNFGFYPIANSIIKNNLLTNFTFEDVIIQSNMDFYKDKDIVQTYEQHWAKNSIFEDNSPELSFIAPTSYGKSSIIKDHILKNNYNRIGIIVPTKSLLNQTYKKLKIESLNYKFILHDDMYSNEEKFIGILTQERALRLIENNDISFDILYIDEAHNLFKKNHRSILLSRLIRRNKKKNPNQKIIYLSPLVTDSSKLKIQEDEIIKEYKVDFNVKEPEYFLYDTDKQTYTYNRFLGQYYPLNQNYENLYDYIISNAKDKNFIYHRRPIKVEKIAENLSKHLDLISNAEIESIKNILREHVHSDFKLIDTIDKGIIYLHAKLPESIKDFLEYKFKTIPNLKYIIANGVILEGVNLPIKTLFILNTHALKEKELTNLIGRVNRLNEIFTNDSNNLNLLLPQIHFISSEEFNSNKNMRNKIDKLRSNIFDDYIENPILCSYDINKLNISYNREKGETKESKKAEILAQNEIIKEFERIALNDTNSEEEKLLYFLIKNGVSNFYNINKTFIYNLLEQINSYKADINNINKNCLEKIYDVFIENYVDLLEDKEIKRLKNKEARNFYRAFLKHHNLSLKEKVIRQYNYFKHIIKNRTDTYYYIGESFGEKKLTTDDYEAPREVYVELKYKNDKDLINLAIVKTRLEEDFVGYKLNNYFNLMFDLELITKNEYELMVYGTNNEIQIKYINMGLSLNMIKLLEKDSQINNISLDENNNLTINDDFRSYMNTLDEYSQFRFSKVIV
jgi:hypothetical protein